MKKAMLMFGIVLLTTFGGLSLATPAAATQCATLSLTCATASGSGYVLNYYSGCAVPDSFGWRTCQVQWSWTGSGTGSTGGTLNVQLNAPQSGFPSDSCSMGLIGCSTSWHYTTVSYRVPCSWTSIGDSSYYVSAYVSGLVGSPTDRAYLSVGLPPCV